MTTPASASEPRTTRANNSREQILDAYEHLLVQAGERATTLDAVATQAKVSKGGLLYHFGSKKALFQALLDRTRTYADEDLEKMRAAPEGASAYYINTSTFQGTPFDICLVALSRLAQDKNPAARELMDEIQGQWYELIRAEIGDDKMARTVLLLGDGMYYSAAFAGGMANPAARKRSRPIGIFCWMCSTFSGVRRGSVRVGTCAGRT
ncbi:TetR/AcrR family transcriptional regulator [Rothia aeria]|uniref:TetR/AcrR family transcriptional regulator n=1 Tax=Rothia aeria TaxID=172042 RepID=UPI00352C9F75